ncbi:TPA: hypothetical protein ACS29I_005078 [Klebsiella oxytoca]
MKTLKVTIANLQEVKNGVICGTQVAFKVIQAGRVLVERVISGKTYVPFTLSYDVSADDESLVVEHDRPDLPHLQLSASFMPQENVSHLGMALCKVVRQPESKIASTGCNICNLKK